MNREELYHHFEEELSDFKGKVCRSFENLIAELYNDEFNQDNFDFEMQCMCEMLGTKYPDEFVRTKPPKQLKQFRDFVWQEYNRIFKDYVNKLKSTHEPMFNQKDGTYE
jgi:hypothetical protein